MTKKHVSPVMHAHLVQLHYVSAKQIDKHKFCSVCRLQAESHARA